MIHNKDSQLVANVDYQLLKIDLDFMITKTLFIRCYSINCGLSLDEFQHNIMHDIVALINNSLSQSYFKKMN